MALSIDLISQFAKITKPETKTKSETTIYGTIKEYSGTNYIKLDGSDLLTPIPAASTVDVRPEDRVMVLLKNHVATITGNITSPAVRTETVTVITNTVEGIQEVLADTVTTDELKVEQARITELEADNVEVSKQLTANSADIQTLRASDVTITGRLDAAEASIQTLSAGQLDVETLKATFATIAQLDATNADVGELEADVGDINTLIFGSATGTTIQTSFANAVIAQLGDAQIKSAMIESVSAGKITAGDIITNNVRVLSESGALLISEETIQINDGTRTRVQIGRDASNDYSINIWDADGKLMFSEGGLTDDGIKEAIIRNDMVSDTANIAAHKLDIDSLFEEINGSTNTIKSTKVYLDDEKQTLDVAFKALSTTVTDQGTTITSHGTDISTIQGQISSKIWQQDIDVATNEMSTQYSELQQEVDSFKSTVNKTYATIEEVDAVEKRVSSAESAITQNANEIELRSEELSIGGRNLIVRKGELTDTYVAASGEIIDSASNYYSSTMCYPIRVEAGETYTFSKSESSAGYFFRWAWYTEDMTVLGRTTNDATSFTWTVPDTAAYVIVSYPHAEGSNPKLEKGTEATPFTLAPEDMTDAINAVDARFASYSTTVEMEAAIRLEADRITSNVSSTYTTKSEFADLEIGAANLIKNSNFANGLDKWVPVGITAKAIADDVHGTCLQFTSPETGSSEYRIYPSTTDNFIHKAGTYSLSFYAKADVNTTIQTNVAGSAGSGPDYSITTDWQRFSHTYQANNGGSITFWANEANVTIYLTKVKMERGDKVTDWTPAPEDMATNSDVSAVESSVNAAGDRITTTETLIQQLSDSIATLVTDGNGQSLMTQTDTGWTFSTGELQALVNSTSENLDTLTNEVGDVNSAVGVLRQAVDDLGVLSEYVKIGTYEDEPCIELGETDSDFKLLITNTRILFMEGTGVPAYITNQSLHIKKAVIEEELQQGEFVWKARSNGNLGLIWKGVTS